MKDYELTVVFHPDLEMNLDPALDKVKKTIEQAGGKITKEENDGKKRLAYTIKSQDYGLYYYVDATLPPEAPARIETAFNISDEILRSMLVKADHRRVKAEDEPADDAAEAKESIESKEEKGE